MNEDMEKMLQEAPAPTLTLEPFAEEKEEPAVVEKEEAVQPVDEKEKIKAILTPQEQKQVDAFVKQIDITNSQMVLQYGASSQKKIADFSESALGNVRTKDLGEIGNELTAVVNELKSIEDGDEEKGFLGLFKKGGNKIANMKAKYAKAEVNVDKICKVLEGHQIQLLKDAAKLDQMNQLILTYYKELSMYILAGKEKIQQVKEQELPELIKRAEESGLPEDTQNDIYRVILTGEAAPVETAALQAALAPRFYALTIRDETRPRRALWEGTEEDTLRGLFLQARKAQYDAAQTEADRRRIALAARCGCAARRTRCWTWPSTTAASAAARPSARRPPRRSAS